MARDKLWVNGNQLRVGSTGGARAYLRAYNYNQHLLYDQRISPAYDSAALATINGWGFNAVRLFVDMDNWTNNVSYRTEHTNTINYFGETLNMWVMPSLYSRGATSGNNNMLEDMPSDAATWWASYANTYRSRAYMIWDILNEYTPGSSYPPSVAALTTWKNAHQPVIDAIRATGSDHLIVVGGTGWAKYFGPDAPANLPNDPQATDNLAYSCHTYRNPPWAINATIETTVAGWDQNLGPLASVRPVLFGEVGQMDGSSETAGDGTYWDVFLPWAEQYAQGWFAWSNRFWSMGIATSPSGAPNGGYGTKLKDYMAANSIPSGTGGGTLDPVVIGPFTVAAMTLTALTPDTAAALSPPFDLTLTGTGFVAGSVGRWNGQDRTTEYVSATSLTLQVTSPDLALAGVAQISARRPTGEATGTLPFTVTPYVPADIDISDGALTPTRLQDRNIDQWVTVAVPTDRFTGTAVGYVDGEARQTEVLAGNRLRLLVTAADADANAGDSVTITVKA